MLAVRAISPLGVATRIAAIAARALSAARRARLFVGRGEKHDEFLAAETADEIDVAARRPHERLSRRLQRLIAGPMAVDVVDALEMVEIDDQQRRRQGDAVDAGDRLLGGGKESAPIGEAGQIVGHGETLDLALAFEDAADRIDHRKGDDESDDGGDFRCVAQRGEIHRALGECVTQAVRSHRAGDRNAA